MKYNDLIQRYPQIKVAWAQHNYSAFRTAICLAYEAGKYDEMVTVLDRLEAEKKRIAKQYHET